MNRLAGLLFCGTFALAGCRAAPPETGQPWLEFSGAKALAQVQHLVDFGPRPPASPAIEQTRAYLEGQLQQFGWEVRRQEFTDATPGGPVRFVNLIARFGDAEEKGKLFLLCSHYDTKTFASIRFMGANDGGSSTGALLEIARVLSGHPALARRTELVFFDGEEAYINFTETDGLYGSRYFAKQLVAEKRAADFRGGILLDMVGDRNLTITLSPDSPQELTRDIFASAEALKVRDKFTYAEGGITDDHTPLNAAGIPTIDLIDFDYPPWHTSTDTMDKLSAESLQTMGAVTLFYLANFAFK